jgi:hypothetical protein
MKSNQEVLLKWQKLVRAFERSGMSRATFCDRHRIKTYQLDYWRRRLRSANQGGYTPLESWIPLQVHDDQLREESGGICLRIGRVGIDVKPGFDREHLAEVLRVVGTSC